MIVAIERIYSGDQRGNYGSCELMVAMTLSKKCHHKIKLVDENERLFKMRARKNLLYHVGINTKVYSCPVEA